MKAIAGIVASLIVALAAAAHAYTLVTTDPNNLAPRRWSGGAPAIAFRISQDTAGPLPNLETGSNAMAAIGRALNTWPAVANIDFSSQTTAVESVGGDDMITLTCGRCGSGA